MIITNKVLVHNLGRNTVNIKHYQVKISTVLRSVFTFFLLTADIKIFSGRFTQIFSNRFFQL